MTATDEQEIRAKAPPTLSPVTLSNFVETHRRTLPGRIDRSLMKSIAGGDQPKILTALQFLGLIEPNGKPTPKFEALRDIEGDDVKERWAEILKSAYPRLFSDFNLATATQGEIDERFREEYKISGDTIRKSVAFFLALARNAGITLSPYMKQTRQRAPRSTNNGKTTKRATRSKREQEPEQNRDAEVTDHYNESVKPARLHRAVQAWIDEMPASGEQWDRGDFENWLAIFKASVERAYKI